MLGQGSSPLMGCNNSCTDDCCYPNHCPYHKGCVTKQDSYCINPENNLTYTQEIEQNIKEEEWDIGER